MWDAETIDMFLETASASRFRDLYHFAVLTGLRRSERLGHSSIATTMDVYSHVLPGIQEEAAQAVGDVLSQARRKRLGTD